MARSQAPPLTFSSTDLRRDLETVARQTVDAVSPRRLLASVIGELGELGTLAGGRSSGLVAAGKASGAMVRALVDLTGRRFTPALAVGPGPRPVLPDDVRWFQGGHPTPTPGSEAAARAALALVADVPRDQGVVVLLSGGASALLSLPAPGLSLDAKVQTTRALLGSGAAIHEMNAVRKHLSAIKGGRLAAACPGTTLTLAISDVVGDDPSVIGSGPTVGDASTFAEALAVIDRYHLRNAVPGEVVARLERGAAGGEQETPTPGDPVLSRASVRVIGSRHDAMRGAAAAARSLGYTPVVLDEPVIGEARLAGPRQLARALEAASASSGPVSVVSSGETTVALRGSGRGGRNQEFVVSLLASLAAAGREVAVASVATDGVDGPTDAAGAVADRTSLERATALGLPPPDAVLDANDTYPYLERLGDLLLFGPTETNVADVQIVLVR